MREPAEIDQEHPGPGAYRDHRGLRELWGYFLFLPTPERRATTITDQRPKAPTKIKNS
jgi:hypothetical protein